MKLKMVLACHDVSEGGLGVCLAEMLFGSTVGAKISLDMNDMDAATYLFSESPARLVVEIAPQNKSAFEQTMGLLSVKLIGKTIKKPSLTIEHLSKPVLDQSVNALRAAWKKPLEHL